MRTPVSHWFLRGPDARSHDWCITIYCEVKTTGAGPETPDISGPPWASQPLAMQWEEMGSHIMAVKKPPPPQMKLLANTSGCAVHRKWKINSSIRIKGSIVSLRLSFMYP